ncbi:putative nucleic acid-binding protein [Flavobacterium arsenatis]|uniref:Nucleic acid-binding protein n=1 Tax=Flavobacterium arsenatis TaxID=1484332 RepID=A0ABU1TMM8_9FLAO|nr:PIN domain-containing protein [Flavobacterium arsenatis]MDR6967190.1 putative nucleic acid-binding protein [Flavobacterium arsenatis]
MIDHVLIDTDVILDFFFDRDPFAQYASEVLVLCENNTIKGFTTPVIISNVYYLLKKTSKHEIIIEKLKQLLSILDIIQVDKNTILDSLNSNFKDFEDALQNFSAVNNGSISIIVTRNIKDFQNSELAVFSPEMYLEQRNSR